MVRGMVELQSKCTALMYAAWNGHPSVVQYLASLGADVAATDNVSAVNTHCVYIHCLCMLSRAIWCGAWLYCRVTAPL